MRHTAVNMITFYLAAGVWLLVMRVSALTLVDPMDAFYASLNFSPEVATTATMAMAVATGSVVAVLTWHLLRRATRARQIPAAQRITATDEGPTAALPAIR